MNCKLQIRVSGLCLNWRLGPSQHFSVMSRRFAGLNQNKAVRTKCLAQGLNTISLVRLKPAAHRSRVGHSTTVSQCIPMI